MKHWQPTVRWMGIAAAAATLATIAGCSTDGEPATTAASSSATANSTTAAEPSINVAALNTGHYPTQPRPAFGKATTDNIVQVEGQRMAQFTVVPFEIDRDITATKVPTSAISSRNNLAVVLGDGAPEIAANDRLLYGFSTTASTPDANLRAGTTRSLNNMVLRYQTAADAAAAADQFAQVISTRDHAPISGLPGLPGTRVVATNSGGNHQLVSFTRHNNYLIYEWYETTPKQQNMIEPTVRKAISLQSALIDQFPATPTKAEAKARGITGSTMPVVDQNHVLIYALPYTDQEMQKGGTGLTPQSMRSVYGPRGMAHFSSDPVGTFNELNEAGSTANAVERSVVFRASTPEAAAKLMNGYVQSQNAKSVGSPAGLPIAHCNTNNDTTNTTYTCRVQKGRYVGEVHSDNKDDAYQQISAQYVIFTKADQNAH